MELYQLRTFTVVAQERGVTRAAEQLYLTPPTVSAHVKALEDELSVQLFERVPSGMRLTAEGRRLLHRAMDVLDAVDALQSEARRMQTEVTGHLTLGLSAAATFLRTPSVSRRLAREHPGITIESIASDSAGVTRQLLAESVDGGFVFGEVSHPRLQADTLANVEVAVVAPRRWSSDRRSARWETLAEQPWVHAGPDCPFQAIVDAELASRGRSCDRVATATLDQTRLDLVEAGVGLSVVLHAEAEAAARTRPLDIVPVDCRACPLHFVYLQSRRDDPVLRRFGAALRDVWRSVPDRSSGTNPSG